MELAGKKVFTTGQISPELTEAILQQLAPEIWAAMRASHQQQTGAPLPPEVSQALGMPPSDAPAPAAPGPAPADPSAPAAPPAPPGPPGPPTGMEPPA